MMSDDVSHAKVGKLNHRGSTGGDQEDMGMLLRKQPDVVMQGLHMWSIGRLEIWRTDITHDLALHLNCPRSFRTSFARN